MIPLPILSQQQTPYLQNGNIEVDITDGYVNAADGAILNSFNAKIDFEVRDSAYDIISVVSNSPDSLDDVGVCPER